MLSVFQNTSGASCSETHGEDEHNDPSIVYFKTRVAHLALEHNWEDEQIDPSFLTRWAGRGRRITNDMSRFDKGAKIKKLTRCSKIEGLNSP